MTGSQSSATVQRRVWHRTRGFWLGLLVLVTGSLVVKQYGAWRQLSAPVSAFVPVITALAYTRNVPLYLTALGAVTPTYSVTVKTQINGQLLRVLFREGQKVKKGELLAEIDPRPYQAQLQQYKGQLARDLALLANARLDLKRYQRLWQQDAIAQQILATQQALVQQDAGVVEIDQGLLAATRVNLVYCSITAPLEGRIGLRLVDPGNFVQISDTTGIAVVNTLDPITVIFTIPEDNIPEVMQQLAAGKKLNVAAYDRQQNILLARGILLTMDNQIDPATGQVKLKAQFQNSRNTLFPSQFVNVKLLVNVLSNVIVVPTAALQYNANKTFVYTVNKDLSVRIKPVMASGVVGDETRISSGLAAGESVVIEGADKLVDGAKVVIANAQPATAPVMKRS
jgi:multidrug efflux system membrane fusion protein